MAACSSDGDGESRGEHCEQVPCEMKVLRHLELIVPISHNYYLMLIIPPFEFETFCMTLLHYLFALPFRITPLISNYL